MGLDPTRRYRHRRRGARASPRVALRV